MKRVVQIHFVFLLCIVLLGSVTITSVSARNYLLKTSSSTNFSLNKTTTILLDPLGERTTITYIVTYTYGRLARPSGFPFPNKKQPTQINITIDRQPQWCIVSLDRRSFEVPIKTFLLKKNQTLSFSGNLTLQCLNKTTPALHESSIDLNVSAKANGNIRASSDRHFILVAPARYLKFDAWLNPFPFLSIQYGEEKNVTLTIKNTGNTITTLSVEPSVSNDSINISSNYQSTHNEIFLDIGEEGNINFTLQPWKKNDQNHHQTLVFNITSRAADDFLEQGPSQKISLQVDLKMNTGKSNNIFLDHMDYIVYAGVLLIVLLIVFLFALFFRKRFKRGRKR